MTQSVENYKGYEIFSDESYFDMICLRKQGDNDFNEAIHVSTIEEAKKAIDEIIILTDYMDWYKNKFGGVIMLSDYWINSFVSGK